MSARIYIEGGGDSKELHIRCRAGFRRLLESCGFAGRMPHLVACGGRGAAFDDFSTAHANAAAVDFVALLVDSEVPVADVEETWAHVKQHDGWDKPDGADDEQLLLMATCMESWIVSDRKALRSHYGSCLQPSALPALNHLESRAPEVIQDALAHATRTCKNAYTKGRRSFEVLAKLEPAVLQKHLPSFARFERVLDRKLQH